MPPLGQASPDEPGMARGGRESTPDSGTDNGTTDCNVGRTGTHSDTGSRSNCQSAWGVFDIVGNVDEWVANWADQATACTDWTTSAGIPGVDESCFVGRVGSVAPRPRFRPL
jgi:formylglycine-generating enzyme required for sulfatase activity